MTNNHFITFDDFSSEQLNSIIKKAIDLKKQPYQNLLNEKQLIMIFEKNSTRTRVSFEIGMNQLGGNAIFLSSSDSQLGRGEPIQDTAKVLSRYADLIMIRANSHQDVLILAKNSEIPVINGLTDFNHPCQILADIMTFIEHRKNIKGKKIAWIGDANNVCNSWIEASYKFKFKLHLALSEDYPVNQKLLNHAIANNAEIEITNDPKIACKDADLITTDTWLSMGDKDYAKRKESFANL